MSATAVAAPALRVRRYASSDRPAVDRLNERFRTAGIAHVLYPESDAEQAASERPTWVRDRLFVAAQEEEIRAGLWLKEQDFWVEGETVRAGWAKYPVSESLIDKAYAGIPGALLFQVLREQPRLMALGLGGHEGPFARLLAGMRWPGLTIPFYVKVVNPARVARELTALRTSRLRRALLDGLAYSGLATAGNAVYRTWRSLRTRGAPPGYRAFVEDHFDVWADEVWRSCRSEYGFLAIRNAAALSQLYTSAYRGVTRLRVHRGESLVGWACLHRMDPDGAGASTFGNLVVGVVADCLASPPHASGVMAEATRSLVEQGVDLLISHQSHPAWGMALETSGWIARPSNFAFYWSPAIGQLIRPSVEGGSCHLTRGDCDGLMRI